MVALQRDSLDDSQNNLNFRVFSALLQGRREVSTVIGTTASANGDRGADPPRSHELAAFHHDKFPLACSANTQLVGMETSILSEVAQAEIMPSNHGPNVCNWQCAPKARIISGGRIRTELSIDPVAGSPPRMFRCSITEK